MSVMRVRRELLAHELGDGAWSELTSLDGDQNVFPRRNDLVGTIFAPHFEIEMNGTGPDFTEVCVDHQQFVESYRMKEVTLHVHAREPDPEVVEERPVCEAGG